MEFTRPEWFLLIPALLLIGWWQRPLRLYRPLRVLCLLLLTLILAGPQLERSKEGLELWVLADRSDSVRPLLSGHLEEWLHLIGSSKGRHDTLRRIDFAGEAVERVAGGATDEIQATAATRIALAAQMAMAGRDKRRAAKVLLLSDGYSTEPLDGLGEQLSLAAMPLYYRLPALDAAADTRLESLRAPSRLLPSEPLLIEFEASGRAGTGAAYRLLRGSTLIGSREFTFGSDGRAFFRLVDNPPTGGSHNYRVEIIDPADPLPGNNSAETWVLVQGGQRVLLLSPYAGDPVAQALASAGIPVQVVNDFTTLNAGSLGGARAVLLNNVPANALPEGFLQALRFYVTEQGGGMAMLGGKRSFGSGGYYDSPIDDILPVSMELKEDHKKLATAMAIVLDRSGSMSMQVGGGRSKMDLANAGAADTIALMGGYDAVTVIAVDSEPHIIVPLTTVKDNKEAITRRVRRIESMGGGIYVYTGLLAAWQELQKSTAGQKHIILFADANDAEEPGDFKELLRIMGEAGATVSVIALGRPDDIDADLLRDIGTLGGGRVFFSADPGDLPAIFAQETVAVTRSAFVDQPVGLEQTAGWLEISPQPLQWPQQLGGYNLSYLRPLATAALYTTDEYRAPLLAFWHRGSGRTAAVTFPLSGAASEQARAWPAYGDFIQTLTRWLMQAQEHRDLGIRTRMDGDHLVLDLFYNEQWAADNTGTSPSVVYQQIGQPAAQRGIWERISPGHYRASLPLSAGSPYLGAVQWAGASLPFGPFALQQNAEWVRPPHMLQALKDAARISGGGQVNLLEDIWRSDSLVRRQSLHLPLLVLLALAFLAEAAWLRWSRR